MFPHCFTDTLCFRMWFGGFLRHGDPWSAEESLGYKYDSESPGFYEVAETTSHGDPGLVAFVEGVIEVRFEFDHPVVNSTMI